MRYVILIALAIFGLKKGGNVSCYPFRTCCHGADGCVICPQDPSWPHGSACPLYAPFCCMYGGEGVKGSCTDADDLCSNHIPSHYSYLMLLTASDRYLDDPACRCKFDGWRCCPDGIYCAKSLVNCPEFAMKKNKKIVVPRIMFWGIDVIYINEIYISWYLVLVVKFSVIRIVSSSRIQFAGFIIILLWLSFSIMFTIIQFS